MQQTPFDVGKLVASPTLTAWSQAYNAGNLFAVLSLGHSDDDDRTLGTIGKDVLHTLEAEYFSLEDKSLDTIKAAVKTASQMIPDGVEICLVVGVIVDTVLYLYSLGGGKILLRRTDKIGTILVGSRTEEDTLSASGFIQKDDLIILQTEEAVKLLPIDTLAHAVTTQTLTDITESLSPLLHASDNGGAATLLIYYKNIAETTSETEEEYIAVEVPPENPDRKPFSLLPSLPRFHLSLPHIGRGGFSRLSHMRKLLLSIVVILLIVLVASIFFTLKRQVDTRQKALFESVFPQAQKKYDEGQGLLTLNKNLAREDLEQARTLLAGNVDKFPKDSSYSLQINDLLKKVDGALAGNVSSTTTDLQQVGDDASAVLAAEKNIPDVTAATFDDKQIYLLKGTAVSALDNTTKKEKSLFKLTDPGSGIGTFLGNLYILDTKNNQILKYAQSGADFAKSIYFSGATVDLAKGVSMAIDGSVWVLQSDGTILKFTRSKPDTFALSNLDKSLSNPTKIFTNADTSSLYVLDSGNSRIVQIGKDGALQNQYGNKLFQTAKDLTISESSKKGYVLQDGKIWEFALK